MNRTTLCAIAAALLTACAAMTAGELVAEPISGGESLADPWQTTGKSRGMADVQALFSAKDYAGALRMLKDIVQGNADLPPAQLIMAQLYSEAGMGVEARAALDKAAIDAPDDPETYLLMAMVAMRDHDLPKADALFRKAKDLLAAFGKSAKRKERMEPSVQSGLASVAEARQDWPAAQKTLEQWLKQDPKNTAAAQRLAYCLFQQKDPQGAVERLRAAAKDDAEALAPEAILAQFYEGAHDRANATKWMAAAVEASPKDLKTRLAVCQWALETGQLEEAQKQAIAAVRLNPKSLSAKMLQGTIANFQRNYEAAELFFEAALKQSPNNLVVTNNLALSLVEQNDEAKRQRALEIAEANAKRYPKMPEVLSTYGLVLYRLGRLDDAQAALRASAAIKEPSVDTAFVMASVAIARGNKAEARPLLERGLKGGGLSMFRQEAVELLGQLKK
jgi:Tfp pilus assembly protein PilF